MSWKPNTQQRSRDDYTLRYSAIRPVLSRDDFSQAAYFTDGPGGERLALDLFITNVQVDLSEMVQSEPHIGDTVFTAAYGKAPTEASISGTLVDARGFSGRAGLTALYRDKLRVSAAAARKVFPALMLPDMTLVGPIKKLDLRASAENHGIFQVDMTMLVLKVIAGGNTEGGFVTVEFDYTAGEKVRPWYITGDNDTGESTALARKAPSAVSAITNAGGLANADMVAAGIRKGTVASSSVPEIRNISMSRNAS